MMEAGLVAEGDSFLNSFHPFDLPLGTDEGEQKENDARRAIDQEEEEEEKKEKEAKEAKEAKEEAHSHPACYSPPGKSGLKRLKKRPQPSRPHTP